MSKLQAARIKRAQRHPAPAATTVAPSSAAVPVQASPARPAGDLQRARRLGHNVVQTQLTLGPADDPYERQADATAKSVMQWLSSPQTADAGAGTETGGGAEGSAQRQTVQRDDLEEDPDMLSMKRAEGVQREVVQRDDLEEDPDMLSMKRADTVQRDFVQRDLLQPGFVQRENFEDEDPDQLSFKRLDGGTVQRETVQRDDLEEDPDMLSMKRADSSVQRHFVQRDAINHGPEGGAVDASVEQTIDSARSGGSALHDGVRDPMEQAFGADFSGVKVHDDSRSHELNRSLSARSFATGNHIFMGEGEYNPGSSGGQELIAHELTHVVQQGAAQAKRTDEG